MADKTDLVEIKHRIRAKRAADQIDGWHEKKNHHLLQSLYQMEGIKYYRPLELLNRNISSLEWDKWIVSSLCSSLNSSVYREIMQQMIPYSRKAILGLPPSCASELNKNFCSVDMDASFVRWEEINQYKYETGRAIVRKVLYQKKTKRSVADAYLLDFPNKSGPTDKELPESRLCGYLYSHLSDILKKPNLTIAASEWNCGSYLGADLKVVQDDFILPALSNTAKIKFVIIAMWLIFDARQKKKISEGLSFYFLPQLLDAVHAKLCSKKSLPAFIFANNSNALDCKLYHLVLDSMGCRCVMLHYSTNNGPFLRKGVNPAYLEMPNQYLWPEFWCWNKQHKKWAEKINVRRSSIMGAMPFIDNEDELEAFSEPAIAVFDAPQHRELFIAMTGIGAGGYDCSCESRNTFLQDIVLLSNEFQFKMAYKAKRRGSIHIKKSYLKYLELLESLDNVKMINPDIAAVCLIKSTKAVISFPFTSTALQAKELGVPCCYYDAVSELENPQPAAYEIPIIQGKNNLRKWLATIL